MKLLLNGNVIGQVTSWAPSARPLPAAVVFEFPTAPPRLEGFTVRTTGQVKLWSENLALAFARAGQQSVRGALQAGMWWLDETCWRPVEACVGRPAPGTGFLVSALMPGEGPLGNSDLDRELAVYEAAVREDSARTVPRQEEDARREGASEGPSGEGA